MALHRRFTTKKVEDIPRTSMLKTKMLTTINTILRTISRPILVNTNTTRIIAPSDPLRFHTKLSVTLVLYTIYMLRTSRSRIRTIALWKIS